MRVLVLGATGMLGYSLFINLIEYSHLSVFGSVRNIKGREKFFDGLSGNLVQNVDAYSINSIRNAIKKVMPEVVINCVGLIKQQSLSAQHLNTVKINAALPHEIANICEEYQAKLIHFSTDCVFSGDKGYYDEDSLPDCHQLYGTSKYLGEVVYGKHLTLRTSIIGHELSTSLSLIDWFLSQNIRTKGFSKAIFSGLPTCYIAKLLVKYVFPNPNLSGLFHMSADPINKYSLLQLVAEKYKKNITIYESDELVIDRSLNSNKFRDLTSFKPPAWDKLIEYMHIDYVKRYKF